MDSDEELTDDEKALIEQAYAEWRLFGLMVEFEVRGVHVRLGAEWDDERLDRP